MNFLATPISWPIRMLAIVGLIAAVFVFGWIKGSSNEADKSKTFKDSVVFVGKKQQEKLDAADKGATKVTETTKVDYEKARNSLAGLYGPGRLHDNRPGAGKAPSISDSSGRIDERSADAGLGSGFGSTEALECTASRREYDGLKADAAQTTLQLLFLQAWVAKQKENWDSKMFDEP